ncbi:hypothetical protein SELMODRAFT_408000 [Selaginella moellendorffii]|uniref:Uncharacterized protein n=1 Tax=Selaginella moellendorffii TaxID=88036 RepID=D8R6V9_SELML|nr:hypothetical protein SELMODRAFT_408000 [Selaginella moellendorffii]
MKHSEMKEAERRHQEYLENHPQFRRFLAFDLIILVLDDAAQVPKRESVSRPHDDGPKKNKYEGRTGTLVQLIRMPGSGDLYAIPHKTIKTGYKAPNSYAFHPVFQDETTNSFFQGQIQKIGEASDLSCKKLMPYYPNAPRNRKPEVMRSHVGVQNMDCRNASYLANCLCDGNPKHMKTPKTTNQLYMNYKCEIVGMGNRRIAAERTRRMHRMQVEG